MSNQLMLGGNIFGHFTNLEQTEAIIGHARDLGISAIDTADVYSEGRSEELIGQCLRNDRAHWFLASKAGMRSHASPIGLGKRENILHKVEASLQRLQTDYIDLYQIHHFDPHTPLDETLEAFNTLITQGKILSAGISNYEMPHMRQLKSYAPHCFGFHQISLNIANAFSSKEKLRACDEQGIQVVAYGSLMRGLFHEKYLDGTIPQNSRAETSNSVRGDLTEDFLLRLRKTAELAQQHKTSLTAIALNWLKQATSVRWTIVGCRNEDQLQTSFQGWSDPISIACLQEAEKIWETFDPEGTK